MLTRESVQACILFIMLVLITSPLAAQTYIIPQLQRDDFINQKSWWSINEYGTNHTAVFPNGYVKMDLINPRNGPASSSLLSFGYGMENIGMSTANRVKIYGKQHRVEALIRVKTLNDLPAGSRGWGFWRTENVPVVINQAVWFMEQWVDTNYPWYATERWWEGQINRTVHPDSSRSVNLTQPPYSISNQSWHTYRMIRNGPADYYELYIDDDVTPVLRATETDLGKILNEDYGFNYWNDNLVYHSTVNAITGHDTIEVYYNGWIGTSAFIVDFIDIRSGGYQPGYTVTPNSPVLMRRVFNEIDNGVSDGLWKGPLSFTAPGGGCVILATAKAEELDSYDDDDDLKIVVDSKDYGYNNAKSWNGLVDSGTPKTIIIDTTLSAGSHSLSFYSEVTPILHDATVLGSTGGSIVLNQTVNETAPYSSNNNLWKTYNFSCDAGNIAIYISGAADEEPGWNHQNSSIDSTDDDELKVVLDATDYGWGSDSSLVGNTLFGDSKTILITQNISGGEHTLKLYVNYSPTVYNVFVWAENGDYSLPVGLSAFSAEQQNDNNIVRWTTESEVDNLGFNLFRAATLDSLPPERARFKQINTQLIKGQDHSSQANEYEFIDEFNSNFSYIWYLLQDISYNGQTQLHGPLLLKINDRTDVSFAPSGFELLQNYPNPFNPQTTIRFGMEEPTMVRLDVFDIRGQLLCTLLNESLTAGHHALAWNGQDSNGNCLASGIYYYRLNSAGYVQTRKMMLIR